MKGYERHAKNVTKLALMGVAGVVGTALVLFIFGWPMLLWFVFNESLALAGAVTVVWIVALLGA